MLTLRQVCDLYVNLLLYQYRDQYRARSNIGIYVKQAVADMLGSSLQECFNLDTAVGAQLDTIGKYVGVPRNIGDPVDRPYYGFSDYDGTLQPNGFTSYLNRALNAQAIWYRYQFSGTENTALTDAEYLLVLKLKIILNSNNGTLASIMGYLQTFLAGFVALTDNADMTLTYTLSQQAFLSPDVLKAYLPKPMGVRVIFLVLEASSAPDTLSTTKHSGSPIATVGPTSASTVSITNGVGPYHYSWQFISETNPGDSGRTVANTPTASSTTFQRDFTSYGTAVSLWVCNVSDSRGVLAQTNLVTVTLILAP